MPISGWHAFRMKNPDEFKKGSFITLKIGGDKTGILLISGRLKIGDTKLVEQSYRFSMDKFTVTQAKTWMKDHKKKYILFEEGRSTGKSINYEEIEFDGIIDVKDLTEYEDIAETKDCKIEYTIFNLEINEVKKLTIDDDEKGVFIGTIASQAKDLGNDVIDPTAFDETIADYKKNKQNIQLYYNHNIMDLPIGIISFDNIEQRYKDWLVKGELNLDTQKGREVYALMKQKALTDMSIGYIVTDADFKGSTRIIKNLVLREASIVGKGMNPKAKISSVKYFNINDEIENKAVPPFQDFPILKNTEGKPDTKYKWDGDAADKRIREFVGATDEPNERYKKVYMWFDPENQDNFGGYKLLYVDVIDNKLQVIPRAIFAITVLLKGGRGGIQISDNDRKTIINQINKYYDKMDLPSPFKTKNIEYLFNINNELKLVNKFDINDVEDINTKAKFNETLRKSGVFSNGACEFLASCFIRKQSKSVTDKNGNNTEKLISVLLEIKNILNNL